MSFYKWYLPTLSEVLALNESQEVRSGTLAQRRIKAEREWCGAIAALNSLLQQISRFDQSESGVKGLVLSGPLPVLTHPELVSAISAWTFTADWGTNAWIPMQLLPAAEEQAAMSQPTTTTLPLLPSDPLAAEQFCLALTPEFSLVLVVGEDATSRPIFQFSFDPEVIEQAWRSLRSRLLLTSSPALRQLDALSKQFAPVAPDYQTVTRFSQLLLAHLPPLEGEARSDRSDIQADLAPTSLADSELAFDHLKQVNPASSWQRVAQPQTTEANWEQDQSLELLQAIAHEVRTPLTTIRTLTRLLLKRQDLNPEVVKRLKSIDQECTEQIDRFNLIFRAVELETTAVKRPLTALAATSLAQVFQQNVPRWQQQASQRNLTLEVILPQKLPMVVSDPAMLDQVLTGLIDRITHSLPPGSHIQVQVNLAGHQLKLQFQSQPSVTAEAGTSKVAAPAKSVFPTLKSVGQLLMFQPETGNLSLNLAVTKNLFQALGGKLIVRQRPEQGEVLTIFLPLETRKLDE